MAKLLLTAFALGLASLDITGTLLAVGALGAGARTRALLAFGCFCILGTIAFGTALSLIVGPRISGIDWGMFLPHTPTEDRVAAFVDIVLGAGLLIWGIVRLLRPGTHPPKPSVPRALGLLSLAGVGVLFALAAIADPAFVSLVVIAGRAELFWPVAAAHSTWTLVSHVPLILVLVFALSGERAGRGPGPNPLRENKPVDGSSDHGRSVAGGFPLPARCPMVLRNWRSLYTRVICHSRLSWSERSGSSKG